MMNRTALRLILAATFVGMLLGTAQGQTPSFPSRKAQVPGSTRLYVFDCGILHIAEPGRFGFKKEELATLEMSVACFLIAHPKGTLVWDTGAVPDNAWTPTGTPTNQHIVLPDGQQRDLTVIKSLKGQLAQLGYSPSDITYLALSHYHYDHTANANEFAGATWLVPQIEHNAMFAEKAPGT